MSRLTTEDGNLLVEPSLTERIFALRGDIEVPLTEITDVEVVADGLATARGIRAPGLSIPGYMKTGTWRRSGEKAFVAARRNRPSLKISMAASSEWSNILVSCDDAEDWAGKLSRP
ncbi:MAG: hypothetical protein WBP55_05490 [Solirubrobacterales bacterium]